VRRLPFALLLLTILAPSPAWPAGGHDKVGCIGCHGTKKVELGGAPFCLQCHSSKEQGGRDILPVSKHASHPFGLAAVNPRAAKVPAELLRADGRFECLSCHDPHPSNPNHAYLRVDTGPKGAQMDAFCAVCHPAKSDLAPGMVSGKRPGP